MPPRAIAGSDLTLAAADARYQPLDSDLTAIAALATTSFGRSLLTAANAAGLNASLGVAVKSTLLTTDFISINAPTIFAADSTHPFGGLALANTNLGIGATNFKMVGQTGTSVEWSGELRLDANDNYIMVGPGLRESGSDKLLILAYFTNNGTPQITAYKFNTRTSAAAAYASYNIPAELNKQLLAGRRFRLGINNTGGNHVFRYDLKGQGWETLHTVGNTDWCTPDQRIMGVDPGSTDTSHKSGLWSFSFGAAT